MILQSPLPQLHPHHPQLLPSWRVEDVILLESTSESRSVFRTILSRASPHNPPSHSKTRSRARSGHRGVDSAAASSVDCFLVILCLVPSGYAAERVCSQQHGALQVVALISFLQSCLSTVPRSLDQKACSVLFHCMCKLMRTISAPSSLLSPTKSFRCEGCYSASSAYSTP